jgi:hypothetical protein
MRLNRHFSNKRLKVNDISRSGPSRIVDLLMKDFVSRAYTPEFPLTEEESLILTHWRSAPPKATLKRILHEFSERARFYTALQFSLGNAPISRDPGLREELWFLIRSKLSSRGHSGEA